MNYKIKEVEGFTVIGKKFFVPHSNNSIITSFWREIMENGDFIELDKINNGKIKGPMGLCINVNEKGFDYIIGVDSRETNPKYATYKIENDQYAVLTCPMQDIARLWEKIELEWGKDGKYTYNKGVAFELYPDKNTAEIYISAKKIIE
ncbi:MAG: GyrI-like domain-containing protein [Lachnospirales bacterium]